MSSEMTDRDLLSRIKQGENAATEFISSSESVDAIGKTVSAFLNTAGGTILCGVASKGAVLGVPEPAEDLAKKIEEDLHQSITPSSLFTVTVDDVDDVPIIIIEVPMGKDQPYVYGNAIYVRSGASTKLAGPMQLNTMVHERAETPERWERRLSPSMTIEDLDLDEVREMSSITSKGELKFRPDDEPTEVLRTLALWRPEGFTQGGDVLFSKVPGVRHPQCKIQLIRFNTDKVADAYDQYEWFDGPLVRIASKLFQALGDLNPSRAKFTDETLERADYNLYSMAALREALVNAVVHRDYTSYSGGVKVSVYPSRIEFWNSGRLPRQIKTSDLKTDHPSIPTNPDIANVFRLRGLMERTGRGTLKIVAACGDLGAPAPKWRDQPSGVTLTLFAATPKAALQFQLNERQRAYVDNTEAGDKISPAEFSTRYAADVSPRQARRDLTELEEFGFIRREGSGPATRYRRLES
jgi:ATP-dependent DNA helicase RecG